MGDLRACPRSGAPGRPAVTVGTVSLADAWEHNATDWIAWARAPDHDGFWDGTWPALLTDLLTGALTAWTDGLGEDVSDAEGVLP